MKKMYVFLLFFALLLGGCSVGEYITVSNEMNEKNVELVVYQVNGQVIDVVIAPQCSFSYRLPYAGINVPRYTETTLLVRANIKGQYRSAQQSFSSQTTLMGGYGFAYNRVWRVNEYTFGGF